MSREEKFQSFSIVLTAGALSFTAEHLVNLEPGMVFPLNRELEGFSLSLSIEGSNFAEAEVICQEEQLFLRIISIVSANSATK